MNKKLFALLIPTIILPLSIFSCSQVANNDIIEARKEVQRIVDLKPIPTLKSSPITPDTNGDIQLVTSYLTTNSYNNPLNDSPKLGVIATVEWIEYPINNANDLTIWMKVDSTEFFGEDIFQYYSINISDILPKPATLIPIVEANLIDAFSTLITSKQRDFEKLMNDAINGEGDFSNLDKIEQANYATRLPELLTSENIDKFVFNGQQRNIQMIYSITNNLETPQLSELIFTFYLGKEASEIKTDEIQLRITSQGVR